MKQIFCQISLFILLKATLSSSSFAEATSKMVNHKPVNVSVNVAQNLSDLWLHSKLQRLEDELVNVKNEWPLEMGRQAERARLYYMDAARMPSYKKIVHNQDQKSNDSLWWLNRRLVFEDNFNGAQLNLTNWEYQQGCTGFGSGNLQCYSNSSTNINLASGKLTIRARINENDANFHRQDGRFYTSARIRQKGPGFKYGFFVARLRLPLGKHLWPALWLQTASKCKYEEIDIMEYRAQEPRNVHFTAHYGRNYSSLVTKGSPLLTTPFDLSENFHEYALLWQPNSLQWFVDGVKYAEESLAEGRWRSEGESKWPCGNVTTPFWEPTRIILNMAVGGLNYFSRRGTLTLDEARRWPKPTFEIDWVRIYQE